MRIYENNTIMLLDGEKVIIKGNDMETTENMSDLNYYVRYMDKAKREDCCFHDLMVHHSELEPYAEIISEGGGRYVVDKSCRQCGNQLTYNEFIRNYDKCDLCS